ncbi:hypothetical protein RW1_043_00520 [Rhodococcus wratislaviensis NBRC 100605]|uniref:Uncharacterized protein n=1 Tax=Rhodococcus wratislaviensis NBRC 100605 TaxID=1219028 RepID=X0Q825_RHOWR|nr:hypothetical protein RW1_043_00520 [Rhodococcus wratislaviensis NBRC 100605]
MDACRARHVNLGPDCTAIEWKDGNLIVAKRCSKEIVQGAGTTPPVTGTHYDVREGGDGVGGSRRRSASTCSPEQLNLLELKP